MRKSRAWCRCCCRHSKRRWLRVWVLLAGGYKVTVTVIAKALGDIARAKGMTQVARDSGLSRESLYKALSGDRSPGFDTVLKVIQALGLKLHAKAV